MMIMITGDIKIVPSKQLLLTRVRYAVSVTLKYIPC